MDLSSLLDAQGSKETPDDQLQLPVKNMKFSLIGVMYGIG